MDEPLAYFLTWTCRGTWLHGDERGSVDRGHNERCSIGVPPDSRRHEHEQSKLNNAPINLDPIARAIVFFGLVDVCAHRGWKLHALNVRSNHLHIVLSAPGYAPERTMQQLKSWATRALKASGTITQDQSPWTRHGSTRYLWDRLSVSHAMRYVDLGQDRPDRLKKQMDDLPYTVARAPRAHARGSE